LTFTLRKLYPTASTERVDHVEHNFLSQNRPRSKVMSDRTPAACPAGSASVLRSPPQAHTVYRGEHAATLHKAMSQGSPPHHTSSSSRSTLCASAIARGAVVKQRISRDHGGGTAPSNVLFATRTSTNTDDSTGCIAPIRAVSSHLQRVISQPRTPCKLDSSPATCTRVGER
jgi:hypothetical protein